MTNYLHKGADIYAESFRIIREEVDLDHFPHDIEAVAVRMIHAAADPAISRDISFSAHVTSATQKALHNGAPILCDSSMTATGIIRSRLPADNDVICHIKSPQLAQLAEKLGITKTAAAVDLWVTEGLFEGAIIAIGNAPTALFRTLELAHQTGQHPAAIIGIPVGFVGAAESKQALVDNNLGLEYLTLRGRRGGSAITVAALNALASRAELTNDHS